MSRTISVSDALYDDVRNAAEASKRSLSAQLEHWAARGKVVDHAVSSGQRELAAKGVQPQSVSTLIASIDQPEGRERRSKHLQSLPYPHFEAHPTRKGYLVKVDEDGTRTTGRFESRSFKAVKEHAEDPNQKD